MSNERDAARLQLGAPFDNAQCVMTAEVKTILERVKAQSETQSQIDGTDASFSNVFLKTLTYAQRFSNFPNDDVTEKIRGVLSHKGLQEFEIAQLANLCPSTVEEAKALIPSLEYVIGEDGDRQPRNDEDLQALLDDLSHYLNI